MSTEYRVKVPISAYDDETPVIVYHVKADTRKKAIQKVNRLLAKELAARMERAEAYTAEDVERHIRKNAKFLLQRMHKIEVQSE